MIKEWKLNESSLSRFITFIIIIIFVQFTVRVTCSNGCLPKLPLCIIELRTNVLFWCRWWASEYDYSFALLLLLLLLSFAQANTLWTAPGPLLARSQKSTTKIVARLASYVDSERRRDYHYHFSVHRRRHLYAVNLSHATVFRWHYASMKQRKKILWWILSFEWTNKL